MPAEFLCGALENHSAGFYRERRVGVGLRARGIERARAGEAGNANFPFHFGVVRLKIRIGDRPVREARASDWTVLAAFDEIDLMETPIVGSEMHGAAADAATVHHRRLRVGLVLRSLAESSRLELRLVGQSVLKEDMQIVVIELVGSQVRPLLKDHHAKAVAGEFLGENAPGRTRANNDEVHFVGGFELGSCLPHFLLASAGFGCQPG